MQLFIEYIQPMTHWLHANPEWALFFTFLISFAESLAIIGSIVPGSVTMTGIGILAGSGVIPIDLTFLAATLGAVTGDGASYLLGYFFSDQLTSIWPFKNYPQWLEYGKEYFARHGGKSVLIGRFIGPLRSIIPVIAGMMHMSHWRFYIANFISAIFWSILYVLPGVIIGAASSELPPENATKLFALILTVLIGIWLLSILIKYLLVQFNRYLNASLNQFWIWARQQRRIGALVQYITPAHETNHYSTVVLCIIFALLTIITTILITLVVKQGAILLINNPLYYAIQSLRNETIDYLFIAITQIAGFIPLGITSIFILMLSLITRHFRVVTYYLSILLSTTLVLFCCHQLLNSPHPTGILEIQKNCSFPSSNLTFITAIFTSLLLYLNRVPHFQFKSGCNITFIVLLILVGFGQMLLGDYWFSDILGAYGLGLMIALIHWISFRRTPPDRDGRANGIIISYISLLLLGSLVGLKLNFETQFRDHQPYFKQYIFTNQVWWTQKKPILPIYRNNRFGHPVSLFNLQYAGSLDQLTSVLINTGWKKENETFYKALLKYPVYREVPAVAQLYLNRKPSLTMRYQLDNNSPIFILRFWRSNYYLQDHQQHIWIGSVHTEMPIKKPTIKTLHANTPIYYVEQGLTDQFIQRKFNLGNIKHRNLPFKVEPILLMIREKSQDDLPENELVNSKNSVH